MPKAVFKPISWYLEGAPPGKQSLQVSRVKRLPGHPVFIVGKRGPGRENEEAQEVM